MATCPRCGGRLERYELWGREQHSCSECGYVGVPVDHGSRREPPESWGEAIRRYQEADGDTTPNSERVDGVVAVPTAESSGSYLEPEIRRERGGNADDREENADDERPDEDGVVESGAESADSTERPDDGSMPASEREVDAGRDDSRRSALLRRKKKR